MPKEAHPAADVRETPLPPALKGFCILSVLLTAIAVLTIVLCIKVLHLDLYPLSDYLLPGKSNFIDLWYFARQFGHLHSDAFFFTPDVTHYNYPAAAAPLYEFFYLFPSPVSVFLGLCAVVLFAQDLLLIRALLTRGPVGRLGDCLRRRFHPRLLTLWPLS